MKLSIIIPSYNDIRIVDVIESISIQTLDPSYYEIVIQEGSTSLGLVELLKENYKRFEGLNIKINQESDSGIFDAINKGIQNSIGDIVFTIGTDDRLNDITILERVMGIFETFRYDLIVVGLEYTNSKWEVVRRWPARKISYLNYVLGYQCPHFASFISRDVYKKFGLFNSKNKVNADFEFFHRLSKSKSLRSTVINDYSVQMQLGGKSSRSFFSVINNNLNMIKYSMKHDPLLLFGFVFKPFIKAGEYLRVNFR